MKWLAVSAFPSVLGGSALAQQNVLYVDDDAAFLGDGQSWQSAHRYLQDALSAAQPGTEIRIARGTYRPDRDDQGNVQQGDREATFLVGGGVTLKGGYAGVEGIGSPDDRDVAANHTLLRGNYNNAYHVVTVADTEGVVTLDGITISDGNANVSSANLLHASSGGGVRNTGGSLHLIDCTIRDNYAYKGGGIYAPVGSVTAEGCTFLDNESVQDGAGIHSDGADITLTNCTFTVNESDGHGAGVYCYENTLVVSNCTFHENFADDNGAGIFCWSNTATVTDCVFTDNSAWAGGAMQGHYCELTMSSCTFTGNISRQGAGGALRITQYNQPLPTAYVTGSTFDGNGTATMDGGAIANVGGTLTVVDCTLRNNVADVGGGLFINGGSTTVRDSRFVGNHARDGGGVFSDTESWHHASFVNCRFLINEATEFGGGLFNSGEPTIAQCTFEGNLAGYGGGMSNRWEGNALVTYSVFSENRASDGGGMHNSVMSDPTIVGCVFRINSVSGTGGGMHNEGASDATVTNSLFAGNRASISGGAIHNSGPAATVRNCTFGGNKSPHGRSLACDSVNQQDPGEVNVVNSILWHDGGSEIWNNDGSTIIIRYSNVVGGWPGEGNTAVDPEFVLAGWWDTNGTIGYTADDTWYDGDYRLSAGSPCVDMGDNDSVTEAEDIDQNLRVVDGNGDGIETVDAGAYEQGPLCGNDSIDPGEECDEGPANSDTEPDACRLDCRSPWCGDGVVDTGESCDNGPANSDDEADACRLDCRLAFCGDGTVDTGEACDDGGNNSDETPGACRTTCRNAFCGDGTLDQGEQCDDGNAEDGDGCSHDCHHEATPLPALSGWGQLLLSCIMLWMLIASRTGKARHV